MAKNCVDEALNEVAKAKTTIEGLANADISKEEISEFVDSLVDLKKANPGTPYSKLIKNRLNELRQKSLKTELARRDQNIKLANQFAYVTQDAFKGKPSEGLNSIFVDGVNQLSQGGNYGIIRKGKEFAKKTLDPFLRKVEELNVKESLQGGDFDFQKNVLQSAYEIKAYGKTTSQRPFSEIGNALVAVNTMLHDGFHSAGYLINDNFQRFFRMAMDPKKIGNPKVTARAILDGPLGKMLDHERMFGLGATFDEKIEIVEKILYDKLYNNDRMGNGPLGDLTDELIDPKTNLPVEKRVSAKRFWMFKPEHVGEGMATILRDFGNGNLMEAVHRTVTQDSKAIATIDRFGVNPAQQYKRLVNQVAKTIENVKDRNDFLKDAETIKSTFEAAAGYSEAPTVDFVSHLNRSFRQVTSMALLMVKTPFKAALLDPMNRAFLMRSATGENFFSTIANSYKTQLQTLIDPKLKKDVLGLVYTRLQDMHLDMSRLGNGDEVFEGMDVDGSVLKKGASLAFGAINSAAEFSHNYLGMGFVDGVGSSAAVKELSTHFGKVANKSFSELKPQLQAHLKRFNFSEPMWDLMRNNLGTHYDGVKGFDPRKLDDVSDGDIKSIIDKYGLKTTPKKFRQDTQLTFSAIASDQVELAKNSTTAANKQLLDNFTSRASALKHQTAARFVEEALKLATQFKGAALAQFDITRRVALSDPNLVQGSRGANALSYAQSLGPYVIAMMGVRYLADQVLNTIEGKEIDDPFSTETVSKTFVNSGVGGLMTDLVFDSTERNFQERFLNFVAGPTVSRGVKAVGQVAKPLASGDIGQAQTKFLENVSKNLPAANVKAFSGKNIWDAILFDPMIKQVNPGYVERKEQRHLRQQYRSKYGG